MKQKVTHKRDRELTERRPTHLRTYAGTEPFDVIDMRLCVCVFLLAGLAVKAAALVPRKPSNRLLNPCFICCVITSASQAIPRQFFTTSHPSSQLCVLCPFPPLPNLSLYASTACFSAPSTPYASPSPPLIHLSPLPSPVIPSVAVLTFSLPSSFP